MNETGKFFVWPASWLQTAQWPIRRQDWRLSTEAEESALRDEGEVEFPQLFEDLTQLMPPVVPDPKFRAELKASLLAAHVEQQPRRFFPRLTDYSVRSWQVIATVPVLVGVVALIWRYFQRSAGQSLEAA